jgi:hypothetical protein
VRGGVTLGEKTGPRLTVEGGVRETQRAKEEEVEPDRQATGGVRIEVPFPVERPVRRERTGASEK